jgi:hypothetical protein
MASMKLFRCVLEAGEGVGGAGVESAANEEVSDGAAPAFREAEAAVVVDAALLRAKGYTGQVFVDGDAEWEVGVEDEAVVFRVDLDEAEGEFEMEELGAGFGGDSLSGYGWTCGVGREDAHVVKATPPLGMGEETPNEFDWGVDDGRGAASVAHAHLGECYSVWVTHGREMRSLSKRTA